MAAFPLGVSVLIKRSDMICRSLAPLLILVCTLISGSLNATSCNADELEAGFAEPPHAAKPSAYWTWLNGYLNREHLDEELKAFSNHGLGGLLIFDVGGRGEGPSFPPAGPAFMSETSVENIAYATKKAQQHGLDVQVIACSSWDMGGEWVEPRHACMALYRSDVRVEGPAKINLALPFPEIPQAAPKKKDGSLAFSSEVALLAVPEAKRLPGHDFIFRLPGSLPQRITHVVLSNTGSGDLKQYGQQHLFSKDFSVAISTGKPTDDDFHEVLHDSLAAHAKPQRFDFPEASARYVRLRILNGHNPDFDSIQLGEFEVFSIDGINVVGSHEANRKREAAELIYASSEAPVGRKWTAENINDGVRAGARGSWMSGGLPSLSIDDPADIVDLSRLLDADGTLRWSVPSGKWTLMRFACANTGERLKIPSANSDGLATDHFSAEATRTHIRTLTDRLQQKLGDLRASGIKQIYLPSYEVRGQLWTPDFLEQFKKYRGYDMTPYLPSLAGCQVGGEERARRFQYDFQKTRGDLLVDAFYLAASEAAHEAGIGVEAEAGGPGPPVHHVPVDALRALGAVDEMRGEFWPWRPNATQLWVVKETACAAHIYGRRRVHMESFTGFRHWQDGPSELKPSADRAFCEGMNHIVWHTSTHQPPEAGKPGWVYGAGSHLSPNLAWWPLGKPFLDYLARCSFLLQQGRFVGDVCYYYGDQGANFVPPKHVDPSLGPGYDYDVTNAQVLLTRMSVEKGRIVLPDGMSYEVLALPDREDMDLAVLQKLESLIQAGATVVGPKPTQSNGLTDYPHRDQQVQQLADRIWGDCDGKTIKQQSYGKGEVISGRTLREVLQQRALGPDFEFSSNGKELVGTEVDFIHRKTPDADIYFVSNKRPEAVSGTAAFRVTGKIPEFWDPATSVVTQSAIYAQKEHSTSVPLTLAAGGSTFVIFREPVRSPHVTLITPSLAVSKVAEGQVSFVSEESGTVRIQTSSGQTLETKVKPLPPPIEMTQPWTVYFPPGWGAPASVTLDHLASWTTHANRAIQYFSGVARYETTAEVPESWLQEDRRVVLDLGKLWSIARVKVNGKVVGTLWKAPYRIDITSASHAGENRLEIEVANTWSNRLVGDADLPEEERYCRTNIKTSGAPEAPGIRWKDVTLHESGLIGPVRLIPMIEKTIVLPK